MSLATDQLVYDLAVSQSMPSMPFVKKEMISIQDSNNGAYSSGEIRYESSSLSSACNYLDWSQGYIVLPVVLAVEGLHGGVAQDFSAVKSDFLAYLKCSNYNLIRSMVLDCGSANCIQLSNNLNEYLNFKLHCELSQEERDLVGDLIGYHPDSYDSWQYLGANGSCGNGSCNNLNGAFQLQAGSLIDQPLKYNEGAWKRSRKCATQSASRAGIFNASLQNAQLDYTDNGTAGRKISYMYCFLRLKDLLFFEGLPMLRGSYFQLTIYTNTCQFSFTKAQPAITQVAGGVYGGSCNPVQISATTYAYVTNTPANAADVTSTDNVYIPQGATNLADGTYDVTLGIVKCTLVSGTQISHPMTSTKLVVPAYLMQPTVEKQYLALGVVKHKYRDVTCNTLTVASGSTFSVLLPAQKNISRIIIAPFLTASSNGTLGISPQNSCFAGEPAHCSPYLATCIKNLRIEVGGQSMYKAPVNYSWEHFVNDVQMDGLNGGLTKGVGSGVISKQAWEQIYGYIVCHYRGRLEDQSVPLSILIDGLSTCVKEMSLHIFVEYWKEAQFDLATGGLSAPIA